MPLPPHGHRGGDHMTHSSMKQLVRNRMRYAGETYSQALDAMSPDNPQPDADTMAQAELEAMVLLAASKCAVMPIRAVSPSPSGLDLMVPFAQLAEFCSAVMAGVPELTVTEGRKHVGLGSGGAYIARRQGCALTPA